MADLRAKQLAVIHMGKTALGLDEDTYRARLELSTGKRSAAALTEAERIKIIREMIADGADLPLPRAGEQKPFPGGTGKDRPTPSQWATIGRLARELGWQDGLEDSRLKSFIVRTAKVDGTRLLSRSKASAIITGLTRMAAQRKSA